MQRTAVTTLAALDEQRERWEALYAADPGRQLFLAFPILRAYLAHEVNRWTVHLLVDDDGTLAGALPLALRYAPHRRLPIARELVFATNPLADYQGMLALPGREDAVIAAFTDLVRNERWDRAQLIDVRDPRIGRLAAGLAGPAIRLTQRAPVSSYSTELPATYEEFTSRLSKATRRASNRALKTMIADIPETRCTTATDADYLAHIDAVVEMNTRRWNGSPFRARRLRSIYADAYRAGHARAVVIWAGETPAGGAVALVDPVSGVYGMSLVAHAQEFDRYSPGKGVLSLMLQDAIEHGFRVYDFLRGDGDYKKSYADCESENLGFDLQRRSLRLWLLGLCTPVYAAARSAAVRLRAARAG